jgi:hypothetical protein
MQTLTEDLFYSNYIGYSSASAPYTEFASSARDTETKSNIDTQTPREDFSWAGSSEFLKEDRERDALFLASLRDRSSSVDAHSSASATRREDGPDWMGGSKGAQRERGTKPTFPSGEAENGTKCVDTFEPIATGCENLTISVKKSSLAEDEAEQEEECGALFRSIAASLPPLCSAGGSAVSSTTDSRTVSRGRTMTKEGEVYIISDATPSSQEEMTPVANIVVDCAVSMWGLSSNVKEEEKEETMESVEMEDGGEKEEIEKHNKEKKGNISMTTLLI